MTPTVPGSVKRQRDTPLHFRPTQGTTKLKYDKCRYKRRKRIEAMFGRAKGWRRVATRCDRCIKVFLSGIAVTATVIY
ncbi:transposase [Vannielia litorea]|nr:transposase [Vannielia litorea]MBY6074109.1 transposase [Vannielia litorea]